MKLGLENIERLVAALGHPERHYPTIHVAGTNGKGSVTAMIDSALRVAGYRSARYTSPHLRDLNERFVVGGCPVETVLLERVVGEVRETIERLLDRGELRAHPTFFEVTTAVAFELFRRLEAAIVVCEVGLGGRLDATNVLRPVVSAITTIGHDHHDQLGDTIALVAGEKAGIIKSGVPVVMGRLQPEASEVVARTAAQRGAPLIEAATGVDVQVRDATGRPRVALRTSERDYGCVEIGLPGAHQIENALVAVRVLEVLDRAGFHVPIEAVRTGLQKVVWPGRLDLRRRPDGREALFDAAHNVEGAHALAEYLRGEALPRALVFGVMRDKDVRGMLEVLLPLVSSVTMTRPPASRAAEPDELAAMARHIAPGVPVSVRGDPREAVEHAWLTSPRVVVAGSIFLVGDVLKHHERT